MHRTLPRVKKYGVSRGRAHPSNGLDLEFRHCLTLRYKWTASDRILLTWPGFGAGGQLGGHRFQSLLRAGRHAQPPIGGPRDRRAGRPAVVGGRGVGGVLNAGISVCRNRSL